MISKLLNNISTLVSYVVLFVVLLILSYVIYKIFIIENDIYIMNEKINQIEMEITTIPPSLSQSSKKEVFEMADLCMNKIFKDDKIATAIDIDNNKIEDFTTIIDDEIVNTNQKEEIFDLKKEVLNVEDETSSIISSSNLNKKKLQKLNLEKLKEKCVELKIPAEGTKAQLIDKIMEEINKDV
jgi:hypothetical protein